MPEFATIALVRFMLVLSRYAQPLLMSRILQLLAANALGGQSYQLSCTVVIISSVVYIGQAIVSSRYQQELNRLRLMTRATLVELIYDKTLSAPAVACNDYSATTLMSTDVDALANVSEMFHEAWAQVLEVIVGMVLLAQQIGWFRVVPLPLIYSRNLRPKQLAWNKATQDRINRVISVVGRIRIIKMLGLGNIVRDQIGYLRQTEIDASKDMRWVAVLANASANALGLFTPAITIILFAAMSKSELDSETAYTTLAILLLVTHSANMIMTIVPRAIASLASFQRIQDFINKTNYQDARGRFQHEEAPTLMDANCASGVAFEFNNVALKSSGSTLPVLENINLSINHGSIVVCTGPTGAASTHDDIWYQQVLDACCIDGSILLSPAATGAGSGYARLSGGQRQRVALARAVYQRHDILVLDDPFSALDQRTQERVIVNLLGPGGLLRNSHTARAYYLFLCLQRWLNVVLELAIAVVAIVVIGLAVFYSTENSADVGIALNMFLVTNTTLLRLIESWTTFEVSVGAAARLKELEDCVPNEEHLAIETMVPCNWPSAGSFSLRGVRVCHGNRVTLSNVELNVQAGAKVFICGQTGSGKSTLLMALLRLCPVQQGSIQVDGVEIAQAAPSIIRERCFIAVPQDAFFQPDISLRSNIDPMDHHSTEEITQALQQLHLWSHFQDAGSGCHDQDNGDSRVLALPLSCFPPLSAGQTQLLSLVRSVLRASEP
ncbi:P-loop containing nucleoside triphosphate hydrolase protein, partial [Aureobasidium melanogenum]